LLAADSLVAALPVGAMPSRHDHLAYGFSGSTKCGARGLRTAGEISLINASNVSSGSLSLNRFELLAAATARV